MTNPITAGPDGGNFIWRSILPRVSQPVGGSLRNADNLAIDTEGNIYIVEDRGGGSDDGIWFAADLNKDGNNSGCWRRVGALGFQWHPGFRVHRFVL